MTLEIPLNRVQPIDIVECGVGVPFLHMPTTGANASRGFSVKIEAGEGVLGVIDLYGDHSFLLRRYGAPRRGSEFVTPFAFDELVLELPNPVPENRQLEETPGALCLAAAGLYLCVGLGEAAHHGVQYLSLSDWSLAGHLGAHRTVIPQWRIWGLSAGGGRRALVAFRGDWT